MRDGDLAKAVEALAALASLNYRVDDLSLRPLPRTSAVMAAAAAATAMATGGRGGEGETWAMPLTDGGVSAGASGRTRSVIPPRSSKRAPSPASRKNHPEPPLTYAQMHDVVIAAARADEWRLALRALIIMHTQLRYVRRCTSTAVAAVLSRTGRVDELAALLGDLSDRAAAMRGDEAERDAAAPDARMVGVAVRAAVGLGRLDVAVAMVRAADVVGIPLNGGAAAALMAGYATADRPAAVVAVAAAARLRQLQLSPREVTIATDALVRAGNLSAARSFVAYAASTGITVGVQLHTVLLRGVMAAAGADGGGSAAALAAGLAYRVDMGRQGVTPNAVTRNVLIEAAVVADDWAAVDALLEEYGLQPPLPSLADLNRLKGDKGMPKAGEERPIHERTGGKNMMAAADDAASVMDKNILAAGDELELAAGTAVEEEHHKLWTLEPWALPSGPPLPPGWRSTPLVALDGDDGGHSPPTFMASAPEAVAAEAAVEGAGSEEAAAEEAAAEEAAAEEAAAEEAAAEEAAAEEAAAEEAAADEAAAEEAAAEKAAAEEEAAEQAAAEDEAAEKAAVRNLGIAMTSVVAGLSRAGRIDDALMVVGRMERASVFPVAAPDVTIAYTAILSSLVAQPRGIARAWALFRGIRHKCTPSVVTYTVMIAALCRRGDIRSVESAAGLLDEARVLAGMPARAVRAKGETQVPTTATASWASRSASSTRASTHAPATSTKPSTTGMASATTATATAGTGWLRPPLVLNEAIHSALFHGLATTGQTARAEALLWHMHHVDGIAASVRSFTTLLAGYANERNPEAAARVFRSMTAVGVAPDRVALNALLASAARVGDAHTAERLIDAMTKTGGKLSPDGASYGALVSAYVTAGDLLSAFDVYDAMNRPGRVMGRPPGNATAGAVANIATGAAAASIATNLPRTPTDVPPLKATAAGDTAAASAAARTAAGAAPGGRTVATDGVPWTTSSASASAAAGADAPSVTAAVPAARRSSRPASSTRGRAAPPPEVRSKQFTVNGSVAPEPSTIDTLLRAVLSPSSLSGTPAVAANYRGNGDHGRDGDGGGGGGGPWSRGQGRPTATTAPAELRGWAQRKARLLVADARAMGVAYPRERLDAWQRTVDGLIGCD
ncbi:hypothetical protein MMPV_003678 [Pyropia vietnamensis]